jgi:plasmid segregation protein ParM
MRIIYTWDSSRNKEECDVLKIGLDVGNGSIVSALKDQMAEAIRVNTLASTYGVVDQSITSVVGTQNSHPTYKINGVDYALGYDAVSAYHATPMDSYSRDGRYENEAFRLMNYLSLVAAATDRRAGGVVEVSLELGVPAEHFRKDTVAMLKSWFRAPIVAEKNGVPVVIVVKKVEVVSQPIAVFLDAYHSDDGRVNDAKLAAENVLIVDGGSGTLDLAHLKSGGVVRQVSEAVGMNDVYTRLLVEIRKTDPSMRISPVELEAQLRAQAGTTLKNVRYGRFTVDVTKTLHAVSGEVWDGMKNAMTRNFPAMDEFERVLLAGGVAAAFETQFKAWNGYVTIVPEPQQAIARGLCKHLIAAEVSGR